MWTFIDTDNDKAKSGEMTKESRKKIKLKNMNSDIHQNGCRVSAAVIAVMMMN